MLENKGRFCSVIIKHTTIVKSWSILTSTHISVKCIYPCADELFAPIFHSFQAVIANTISIFK